MGRRRVFDQNAKNIGERFMGTERAEMLRILYEMQTDNKSRNQLGWHAGQSKRHYFDR